MKVVVSGGTGLIGSKVVAKLTEHGHEARGFAGIGCQHPPQAPYFGVVLDDHTLVPAAAATVFPTRFTDWLVDNAPAPVR